MSNLTDAEIIQQVTALDAEIESLADNAVTMVEQFRYSQAAGYTSKAAVIHQEERRWVDLPQSYSYWYNLTQAADSVRPLNKPLARRLVTLANKINPPARKDYDDERPDCYPGVR